MTGSDFRDYVVRVFKRTDKDSDIYEAMTDVVMNMKLVFLPEDFKEEAYTTSITTLGNYKIGVPSDFGHIIGDITGILDNQKAWIIRKISKESFDEMYPDRLWSTVSNVYTARPRHFTVYADQIYLGPVPDKTSYQYQMNYTTEEELTITSSTTDVPFTDRYRWVVRYGVLAELYFGLGMDEEGVKWQQKFDRDMAKIIANDDFNVSSAGHTVYHGF